MRDLPRREEFGHHVHDALFRLMLSDPARADAVPRTHSPRQLRFLLEWQPARSLDGTLVHQNLRQFCTDSLFVMGGTGNLANAAMVPEQKFRPERRTPGQTGGYLRTARTVIPDSHRFWFLAMIFHTGNWNWNVSGVIDESSDDWIDVLRPMHDPARYFVRETRKIDCGQLSCEPASWSMLGMVGPANRQLHPRDELAWIWREDVVPHDAGIRLGLHLTSLTLATSGLEEADLVLETGLVGEEIDMGLILHPKIEETAVRGFARRRAGVRSAPLSDMDARADAVLSAGSLDEDFRNGRDI